MNKTCPTCGRSYPSADTFCPYDGARLSAAGGGAAIGAPSNESAATVVDAADPLVGRVLDNKYELTRLLGVGGMGRVYLGQHRFLQRDVAVKILHRGRVSDPTELVRFNRTAVHAGTIVDDHVAQVYDFGETNDGLVYLAMEYVPGETVTRMLKKEGPFEPARVAELTRQMAKGLDAAHAEGIIHRDLKPDNIMVMRDRHGREMLKIVDFGIAKAVGTNSRGVTEVGAVVGTLLFMSPEQLAGSELDRRSDLYSLALVVFHMLTGALPFTGTTPEQVIYARFDTAGPRPLATVRPAVSWPPGLQAVIDRALARDTEVRFATAGEFADALTAAIGPPARTPVLKPAKPNGPPNWVVVRQRSAAWFRDHGRQVGRVAVVGVVAVLVVTAGASAIDRWRRPSPPADTLSRRIATGEARVDPKARQRPPVVAPGNNPAKPNGINRPPASPSRPPTEDPEARRRAALDELALLRAKLDPDSTVSPADARAAIRRLDAMMPKLQERTDSLFVMLYQSHAYYHLGDLDKQCDVLRRIRTRAGGTRLEGVVEGYFGYGKCP